MGMTGGINTMGMTGGINTMGMLRVMIADDDNMVRFGLRGYIETEENLQVVAEASSGQEAIELAEAHKPDVVILDVRMEDGNGVDACREIRDRHPDTKVIMLTAHSDDEAMFDSIMAGAAGYLIKGVPRDELIRSLRAVGQGQALLDPQVAQKVLERVRSGKPWNKDTKLATLSATEERVLDLVAEGLTNRQIAEQIHLPEKTVKNNVSSMMKRFSDIQDAVAARSDPRPQVDIGAQDPATGDGSQAFVDGRPLEIAVLLPCRNEETTIGNVVRDFRLALPSANIYVYDNASTDRTCEVAAEAGAICRRVPMLGKGNVLRRMFTEIDADAYVLADGDDTYEAAAAPAMVNRLFSRHLDMIVGLRIESAEVAEAYRPGHRLGNLLLTRSVHWLFGAGSDDMLSGYRVFSRRYVKSFPAYSRGFETETEMTVHALDARLPYEEMPTQYRARPEESESKLRSIPDGIKILKFIVLLCKDYRPLMFFGSLAAGWSVLALPSFVLDGWTPFGVTFAILAGVFAFLGVLLESLGRSRKEMERTQYLAIPATAAGPVEVAPVLAQTADSHDRRQNRPIPIRGPDAAARHFGHRRRRGDKAIQLIDAPETGDEPGT